MELLKESENPPIVWPEEKSIVDFEGQWWVVHTKSRNEKALADDLMQRNICYFLPMSWKVRRIRGRKIRSLLPLFGGYMFFCGNEKDRLEVLRTNRVANLIEVWNVERFLRELTSLEQAISVGADLTPHKYIKKGQLCHVIAGPLAGSRGIAIKTLGKMKLILRVEMLGQAASVEIDTDSIEIVDE